MTYTVITSDNLAESGISEVTVTNGGSGYTTGTTVTIIGDGTGATGKVILGSVQDQINTITLVNGGSDYTVAPTISFANGTGGAATAILEAAGSLTEVTVDTAGSGYTSTPTVAITGGGGTGATVEAILGSNIGVDDDTIVGFTVTANGSGYTSTPTVDITGGGGTGAVATAVLGFAVASITVDTAGSGYTQNQEVIITGDGTDAEAYINTIDATEGDNIVGVAITNSGSGYTQATVSFTGAGTGATGVVSIDTLVSKVRAELRAELGGGSLVGGVVIKYVDGKPTYNQTIDLAVES